VETGDLRAIKVCPSAHSCDKRLMIQQIVKHRFANNPKTLELFRREIDICQSLQHENICRLIQSFEDPQHVCLVLEYVDGGDMLDHIMKYESPKGGGLRESHSVWRRRTR
jgi:serine/threonine/tyrosine protein kinase RAD53